MRQRARTAGRPLPEGISELPLGIVCTVLGCVAVYAALFAIGAAVYGRTAQSLGLGGLAVAAALAIRGLWKRRAEPMSVGTGAGA